MASYIDYDEVGFEARFYDDITELEIKRPITKFNPFTVHMTQQVGSKFSSIPINVTNLRIQNAGVDIDGTYPEKGDHATRTFFLKKLTCKHYAPGLFGEDNDRNNDELGHGHLVCAEKRIIKNYDGPVN